ncbi:hypothetical protein ACOI1C_03490 [Bacillus sp. DJP31]|uniref:hypothetical protein n=1 Tax=Bacillus sp. DJP31 TaxID=3409789 RepID=UPI003BB5FA21
MCNEGCLVKSQNERGSSLLLVLLVSLVFMVLGLSIISASIGGAKRTEFRNAEVISTQDAINTIEQITAEFKVEMQNTSKYPLDEKEILTNFNSTLETFSNSIERKYTNPQIEIENLTEPGKPYSYIDTKNHFTRVLELKVDLGNKEVLQNLILSPTPSFLEYAVGSTGIEQDQGLYLNGSPFINGNVYANDIYLRDQANYIDSFSSKTADTLFPAVKGNLYVQRFWNSKNIEEYTEEQISQYFYQNELPTIRSEQQKEFLDVNFRRSFADILNDVINDPTRPVSEDDIPTISEPNRDQMIANTIQNDVYDVEHVATTPTELQTKLTSTTQNYLLYTNGTGQSKSLTVTEDLTIPDGTWLIVHGDLTIFPFDTLTNPIKITGNILVTGNIVIAGNEENLNQPEDDVVSFDSTIYSLGKATILNTNIEGYNDKQLVLLSLGKMTITRINEFMKFDGSVQSIEQVNSIKPLKAFFYTDDEAELYGVGSMFYINGGLFAREKLVINATRWNTIQGVNKTITIPFTSEQLKRPSRFNVVYDKNVIIDQLDALPRVDRLQVIPDNLYIEPK